jgi:benzylsuccinate CoA-transferase BbsE subunit
VAGALSGFRVLDLADEKGMFCARLLAGMGARVIRIQKPNESRSSTSESCYLNSGKERISLDLGKTAGQGLFKRLVETADILIETNPPGFLDSLGLGFSDLSRINPRLIMTSITDFGQTGPYRDYRSSDLVDGALGGWLSVCGESNCPLKPFGSQTLYAASLFAANGIMLALWHRHQTNLGQHLDISIMESVAATSDHVLVRYFYEGIMSWRRGSRHWNNAFGIFPCREGYILLSLFHDWETLVAWLDSEGMAADLTDEKWRDREARIKGLGHVVSVLDKWTKSHTAADLVEKGQLMRFPWAKVASVPELLASPQLAERKFFTEVEIEGKKHRAPGAPFKMSLSPWHLDNRVSTVGEDNKTVYGELGLSGREIENLIEDGVI